MSDHAAYFAAHLPQLTWQPTDLPENFPSIRAWAVDDCMDAGGTTSGKKEVERRQEQPPSIVGNECRGGII